MQMTSTETIDFLYEDYETCYYIEVFTPLDVDNSILRHEYKDFNLDTLFKSGSSNLNQNKE
jgi:hypothetical protein